VNLGTGIIGAAKPASITFIDDYHNTGSSSSYTFSSIAIGAASAKRWVIVDVNASTVTSVVIGGVTATVITANQVYIANVPTGTSISITVNFAVTAQHCGLMVTVMDNLKSGTPLDSVVFTQTTTTNPKSGTLSVQKGGVVAAFAAGGALGASMTYSFGGALTTDVSNSQSENLCLGAGHALVAATDAALAVNVTRSGTNNNFGFYAYSFR